MVERGIMGRGLVPAICLTLLLAGCGDGELTMNEYATQIEGLIVTMNRTIDTLDAEIATQESTLEDARSYWDAKVAARRELIEGLEAIEPPREAAEMHASAIGIVSRLSEADNAVAELAGTMETGQDAGLLLESPEFLATEVVDVEAMAMCEAAQAEFDSTADREVFGDTPWIPSELREVVVVAFGCTKEERGLAP
ncbi:MAG: hypothetical protein GY722_28805 [bacterium]|nr:hypothetical protein [bacterium]